MGADGIYYEGETANIYTDFWPNFSPNNTSFEFIYGNLNSMMKMINGCHCYDEWNHAWIMNTWVQNIIRLPWQISQLENTAYLTAPRMQLKNTLENIV